MPSSYQFRSRWATSAVLVGLVALISCQNATSPDVGSGPSILSVSYTMGDASRIPDSTFFRVPGTGDSGQNKATCVQSTLRCAESFTLQEPLGSKILNLELYTLGILTDTVQYTGASGTATVLRAYNDVLDTTLLGAFAHTGPKNPTAADLVAFYASLLFHGDPIVSGQPLPVGMNADSVKKALVLLAVDTGLTADALVAKNLLPGLTLDTVRVFLAELVGAGRIPSSDTAVLLHPVRVQVSLSVGDLVVGGPPVGVTGAFAWNKGSTMTSRITVHTPVGVDSTARQFQFPVHNFAPIPTDTGWIVTGNLSLATTPAAVPGEDTLVVTLSDNAGHSAIGTATYMVSGALPPILSILAPSKDTTVPNATGSVAIMVSATDPTGIDSVKIGKTKLTTAPFTDTIYLPVGTDTVVVQAWNKAGIRAADTLHIARAAAPGSTVPPKIVQVGPSQDTLVPWATKTLALSWVVTGDSAFTVTLDGRTLSGGTGGIYQSTVNLPVGMDTFTLQAIDLHGNQAEDAIHVTRGGDVTPPAIVHLPSQAVPYTTTTDTVSWTVTDDVKMGTVEIIAMGVAQAVSPVGSTYSLPVTLNVGTNKFVIVALDSAGNQAKDSVLVVRAAPAPVHGAAGGNYIGTVYDTITSPGADSIQISLDGANWTRYSGDVELMDTGTFTLYARAWPGQAVEAATYSISKISMIAVGGYHAVFVKTNGSLWTTGRNNDGQLGTGNNTDTASPVQILSSGAVAAAAGYYHTLVLLKDGSLYGTGYNGDGEMGNGGSANLSSLTLIASGVSSVYAGLYHSLYISNNGTLMGTGINNMSQLGAVSPAQVRTFQPIASDVGAASASGVFTLFTKSNNLYGCGSNASGELGIADTSTQWSPLLLDSNVTRISAGWYFSLRTKSSNNTLWGTGDNTGGQLGNDSVSTFDTPIQIPLTSIASMATGWAHSLIVGADGTLYSMGDGSTGENGSGGQNTYSPTKIMSGVAKVFAGNRQSFALKPDGTLWVAGRSTSGELGVGSRTTLYTFQRLNF